jgi:hypothetical protein
MAAGLVTDRRSASRLLDSRHDGRLMMLRRLALSVIAGSLLAGGLSWPPAQSAPAVVDIGNRCSAATRRWAEASQRRWEELAELRRMSVLCEPGGRVMAAQIAWRSPDGNRSLSWRPVTTFIGALARPGRERIDIFDAAGRLIEYAVPDWKAQRVVFFSPASELTGYGTLDPASGGVQRFSIEGRPQAPLALPIPSGMGNF